MEFDHVSFAYPGAEEEVLSDITFRAKKGETVAFIGSTGSGKSTLVNLIPRFFDVTAGTIRVDGVDVRNMDLKDLRDRIGYVPQKGVLFWERLIPTCGMDGKMLRRKKSERLPGSRRRRNLSIGKKRVWTVRSPREEVMYLADRKSVFFYCKGSGKTAGDLYF